MSPSSKVRSQNFKFPPGKYLLLLTTQVRLEIQLESVKNSGVNRAASFAPPQCAVRVNVPETTD